MLEINSQSQMRRPLRTSQAGATVVEFALLVVIFLMFVFGIMELARLMYVFNTLQESTRRGASAAVNADFSNQAAMDSIRYDAVFRNSAGDLILAPVSDKNIRIDYLALLRESDGSMTMTPIPTASLPSCAALARQICMANPNAANCIRFVRVRVCDERNTAECDAVPYKVIVPLVNLTVNLPKATTIATAESLGVKPGTGPCS